MADDASIMQRVVDGRNHSVFLFEKSRECGHQLSHPFEEEDDEDEEEEEEEEEEDKRKKKKGKERNETIHRHLRPSNAGRRCSV